MSRRSWVALLVSVTLLVLGLPAPGAVAITQPNQITYVYDELGRLEAAIDPAATNGIARYTYDARGNLLSIARQSSTATSIIDFHPKLAKRDARVTVYGAGFSSTPASNTVRFGGPSGTQATVVSATTTQLVVDIPDTGALDGAIHVQAPGGSATSTQLFTEDTSGPPTITGFTPTIGATGTAVTITGTRFDPTPARNHVFLNGIRARVTAATATSLSVEVPPFLTTGKISVQTQNGEATSAADFVVPPLGDGTNPAPYQPSQLDSIQRVNLGVATNIAVTTAGHASMVMFDATEDQRVFGQISTFSGGQARVKLLDPYGRLIDSILVTASQAGTIDTATLRSAGTHVVLVDPVSATTTGSLTLTMYDVPADVLGQAPTDGTPVTTGNLARGQGANYTFGGSANQRVSLVMRNSTIAFGNVHLRHPKTWVVADPPFINSGIAFMEPVTLPDTGTYALEVDPSGGNRAP
jgi:YD repeat-containing protein